MFNWYPGHMAKTLREIKEQQKIFDLFIILLDSRIPLTSFNPELYKIINQKPILFVFTKADKVNKDKLNKYILENYKEHKSLILNLKSSDAYKKLSSKINEFYLELTKKNLVKGKLTPNIKCVVMGIPNVGKSTLINLLSRSSSTKVGNMPGVTKSRQWINCANFMLLDTPGVLMPKIENDIIGAKLAITSSIKLDGLNKIDVLFHIYRLLSNIAPNELQKIGLQPLDKDEDIYQELLKYGQNNKMLLKNNEVDINKVINKLIKHFQELNNIIYD